MFSFWNRKGNKSPGHTSNIPLQTPQKPLDLEPSHTSSKIPHIPNVLVTDDVPPESIPVEAGSEPVVAAVPNPHDAAVDEVYAKLLQAEHLSSTAHPPRPTDPLTETAPPRIPSPEPLFDPATGELRGFFEAAAGSGSGEREHPSDEVWTHLARIRQIQSEIATMHRRMEGIGDESGTIGVEVDNDVDVDTVPTQEEEEAVNRAKEFDRLPGRFKGRSDNIDSMMAKVRVISVSSASSTLSMSSQLNDLSQAVTSFHALQPPPLCFDSVSRPATHSDTSRPATHSDTSRPATHSDTSVPPGGRATPIDTVRTRVDTPPTAILVPKIILDEKLLHESPITLDPSSPKNVSKTP